MASTSARNVTASAVTFLADVLAIRKERYSGSCSRSFYVGDAVTQDDVKAKFENGVLTLEVPKKEEAPKVEEKKYISIEG